ncbi:MAG TPA: class I SAM-dependent methyltransferase [Streptosporangiaceae bacterium]|nr:class I SAM-dependent methyltransferase [Streptosporangiaceae bacterium]
MTSPDSTGPGSTAQGQQAAAMWQDDGYARDWARQDSYKNLLAFPREMAAVIVGEDNPTPGTIVDIGSGPGDFLAAFLEHFPSARGVWTDASEVMLDLARERLAPFGDRVEFRLVDMTALPADLAGAAAPGEPGRADVITTSRAAHHLDRAGLSRFYADAADRLSPGGWLINLDHIGPSAVWDQRLRAARKQFGVVSEGAKHHHNYPLTSVEDHLQAFGRAGFTDVEVAWRAFFTCLFMGRKTGR